ncbi:Uncharacterised protein [Salmonella enterica]|uniref:Uncharacterized protein n=1 Tax=Salmonella enterica subsp. arizonae TaxID=59203 RepID=A0A2X4WSL1_SALER|nr:hypothetical protein N898_12495 [Salmonella enterica subsp. arizonae serovar 62:z36:- str. RKS2983]SQI26964.1 Uncharacterised protein [Salmonella enterica subsp. arizonae]SUF61054.1 Uncharacterised protein [Salmonella enterica]SUG21271.1 Uncharacterised protein [Salmonella enterica subsp. arizonae]
MPVWLDAIPEKAPNNDGREAEFSTPNMKMDLAYV